MDTSVIGLSNSLICLSAIDQEERMAVSILCWKLGALTTDKLSDCYCNIPRGNLHGRVSTQKGVTYPPSATHVLFPRDRGTRYSLVLACEKPDFVYFRLIHWDWLIDLEMKGLKEGVDYGAITPEGFDASHLVDVTFQPVIKYKASFDSILSGGRTSIGKRLSTKMNSESFPKRVRRSSMGSFSGKDARTLSTENLKNNTQTECIRELTKSVLTPLRNGVFSGSCFGLIGFEESGIQCVIKSKSLIYQLRIHGSTIDNTKTVLHNVSEYVLPPIEGNSIECRLDNYDPSTLKFHGFVCVDGCLGKDSMTRVNANVFSVRWVLDSIVGKFLIEDKSGLNIIYSPCNYPLPIPRFNLMALVLETDDTFEKVEKLVGALGGKAHHRHKLPKDCVPRFTHLIYTDLELMRTKHALIDWAVNGKIRIICSDWLIHCFQNGEYSNEEDFGFTTEINKS